MRLLRVKWDLWHKTCQKQTTAAASLTRAATSASPPRTSCFCDKKGGMMIRYLITALGGNFFCFCGTIFLLLFGDAEKIDASDWLETGSELLWRHKGCSRFILICIDVLSTRGSVSRRRAQVTPAVVIMWCGFSVGRSGVCDVTDPCLSDLRLRSESTHVHLWEASAAAEPVNDHMIVVPLWWTDEWWCETSISYNKDHFYLLSAECVSIYNSDAASPRIFNDGFHEYRQNQPVIYILLLCFISSAAQTPTKKPIIHLWRVNFLSVALCSKRLFLSKMGKIREMLHTCNFKFEIAPPCSFCKKYF